MLFRDPCIHYPEDVHVTDSLYVIYIYML